MSIRTALSLLILPAILIVVGLAHAADAIDVPRLKPGTHRKTVQLADGKELRYTLVVPEGYDSAGPVPLVVALHYGGRATRFYGGGMLEALMQPALGGLGAVMVAPDSVDGNWATPGNQAAVLALTHGVMERYAIDPKRVLITGFSMGGHGTWFLGNKHQDLFTAAIPIAGRPSGELPWKIPVHALHSAKDEIIDIDPARAHVAELKAAGADAQLTELGDLGHTPASAYVPALRGMVPWLDEVWKP